MWAARPAAAVPDLIEAVSDSRPDVRWRAVWALGQIGPDAAPAVPVLRAALSDADLRWRAAEALGGIGPPAAAAVAGPRPTPRRSVEQRALARRNRPWGHRRAPGGALSRRRPPSDPAENVRLAAVTSLVELRAETSLVEPVLLAALHDPDKRVRQQAVRGVGRLDRVSPAAWRGLEAASRDPDEDVREKAVQVLAKKRGHTGTAG